MSVTSSISASDRAAIRSTVRDAFDHPTMYGLDRRYVVMTAFLVGCDTATNGALFKGFEEWLIGRHEPSSPVRNVSWEGLVVRLRCPTLVDSYRRLDEEQSAPLLSFLRDEVDAFLAAGEASST